AATETDIVSGYVTLVSLFGIPMVNLTPAFMPYWQQTLKRVFDKTAALLCLLLLSPVFLYLIWRVKRDTLGPVLFKQERIGKNGKPFMIYKFRTMFVDAEKDGPRLSCKEDPRVTPFGRLMRRYRLDELPQFVNVLKGDMSLVGPRPERQYFVDKIIEKAPHYYLTQSVLPGITSWGMVKFGYANSVDKMIDRLAYDMLYLENQSLLIDLKILLFTLKPLFKGKGV
ncbi:MAG: sugar transferase, partial [Bacteroidales bacterium]|nr:sugar transferase [Bacteroidales bacterium]